MALQQRPEIDLFYGNSDEMGIGACIAAEEMGRRVNEDIWCVSIDGNDVTLDQRRRLPLWCNLDRARARPPRVRQRSAVGRIGRAVTR